ncbi:unnamed protein product [Bursaphelenchus okinawaensis]|uniref:G_PROTEIN_RECEP_F1_2 domain-containing protein n=1 Tax=Bursaphelenchus okinawaensis TaxID=465554 RepID=A0A811KCY3_9BILA|nr:unnamed protein product [Bursaphelenchus okinawaensis]CAG9101925.1 unnamed protein product [Bursaphelenchus okinawaensis]
MDLMLRRREFFEAHYNCTFYNTSAVPDELKRQPRYGGFLFGISVVYIVLYIPCLYAMTRRELYSNPCYKIMTQMAICDLMTIPITGLLSGYLSYYGIMYCDARLLNNVVGTVLLGVWMAYSWAAVILAINRISHLTYKSSWFEGNRVYYWLAMPLAIGIASAVFGNPVAYSSIMGSYTFNPFIESVVDVDNIYAMPSHTADNLTFSIVLPSIYIFFFVKHRSLLKIQSHSSAQKKDYSLFMQCFLISICITMAATGYTFIQFLGLPPWVGQISHVLWLLVQGSPPIVYLSMNHSIQRILLETAGIAVSVSRVSDISNTDGGTVMPQCEHKELPKIPPQHEHGAV